MPISGVNSRSLFGAEPWFYEWLSFQHSVRLDSVIEY